MIYPLCLKTPVLSIFILFACHTVIYNQNPSQQFLDVFERETQAIHQNHQFGGFKNVGFLSFFPDTLPGWFFNPPQSTRTTSYAIGISDPDLPQCEAFEQAYIRAKMLAVLFNSSTLSYIRDIFTSSRDGVYQTRYRQRFDTFFRLTATELADSTQFTIVSQHMTRYNEAIVLLSFTPSPDNIARDKMFKFSSIASVLYIEAQIGEVFEPQSSYDLKAEVVYPEAKIISTTYNSTNKGDREQTYSTFKDKEIRFPLFVYRYSNPFWQAHTRPLVSHHGLWGMYMRQMLQHITLTTEQETIRLRSLGQQTEPESLDMAREISSKRARINLNSIEFTTDDMIFDMTIEKLQ
jgi:hypothetical protein